MGDFKLSITEFLEKSRTMSVIDVRSPSEFDRGHIPGAFNLPLFSNEERSIIGTLYLQKGSSDAIMKGLELVGPKMKVYADQALNLAQGKETLLHCWRGGMRSKSMAWLLNTIGIKAYTLEGGYKSYRNYVQASFSNPINFIVIGGMTGSGKTDLLEVIESKSKQILNLELIAKHKGSVFGNIGMPFQPSTEQFENDLFSRLMQLNLEEPIYVEDESLAIGRVFIPMLFFKQMSSARCINLIVPIERRVRRLIETYTYCDKKMLVEGVKRIERRLGLENAAQAIEYIYHDEMGKAAEIILRYYDKIYSQSMNRHKRKEVLEILVTSENNNDIAHKIISAYL